MMELDLDALEAVAKAAETLLDDEEVAESISFDLPAPLDDYVMATEPGVVLELIRRARMAERTAALDELEAWLRAHPWRQMTCHLTGPEGAQEIEVHVWAAPPQRAQTLREALERSLKLSAEELASW